MTSPTTWTGDALPLPGHQLLLSRDAVTLLLALTRHYAQLAGRANGTTALAASPQLAHLIGALEAAHRGDNTTANTVPMSEAMSEVGHADTPTRSVAASSPIDDQITTTEAAEMLQLSERQTRRLATSDAFGAIARAGTTILIRRAEVLAYAATRRSPTA